MATEIKPPALGWCKVHLAVFEPGCSSDADRLLEVGICRSCDFAMSLVRMKDDPRTVRVNGRHWRIGKTLETTMDKSRSLDDLIAEFEKNNRPEKGNGMGGRLVVIRFNDGELVFTNDLWGQGDVPEMVGHLLPDNAEFVKF